MSTDKQKLKKSNFFSVIGWVTGAFSLLNLIDDFDFLKIRGRLDRWLQAYDLLITNISDFLFGWVSGLWLGISDIEKHLVVLCYIFLAALKKAMSRGPNNEDLLVANRGFIISYLVNFFLFLSISFLAVILPTWISTGAYILIFAFAFGLAFMKIEGREYHGNLVIRELAGILAIFTILIAFNFNYNNP